MSLGDINPNKLTAEEQYSVISGAWAIYLVEQGHRLEEIPAIMAKYCARMQIAMPGRAQ